HDREARLLGHPLDRMGDVADAVSDPRLPNPRGERCLARLDEPLRLGRDLPYGEGIRAIGDEAVERDAHVDRDQVALIDSVCAGNPVHDHRVWRDAERREEALIPLRCRDAALRADELLANPVELLRRDPRLDVLADVRDRLGDDAARGGHLLDLGVRLADDHARAAACSSACWSSAKTSFSLRPPWPPTAL